MCRLGVEDLHTVNIELICEAVRVFTEIVENLDDLVALEDLSQPQVEGVNLQEVDDKASGLESDLEGLDIEIYLKEGKVPVDRNAL
jgi:hypothetical protein